MIVFMLNGEKILAEKLELSSNLKEIREQFNEKLPVGSKFLFNGTPLDEKGEGETTVENVLSDSNKILMEGPKAEASVPAEALKIKTKPLPGSKKVYTLNGIDIYLYPSVKFSDEEDAKAKCIMVVGQTGSGKTTLLNSLINCITGVQYEDDYRYIVIYENFEKTQDHSQTSDVTVYYIKSHNGYPPIKIIDTPGFGDTRGIDQNKIIRDLIEKKFRIEIQSLTAICLVTQASNTRLTNKQKYIFNSIFEIFGEDVAENFFAMLTFCDEAEPPVLSALKAPDSVFGQIIPKIKHKSWYLSFNNSGIFSKATKLCQKYWNIGMDSFKDFLDKLESLPDKSLQLTKQVLSERKRIEINLADLQPKLEQGLSMMEVIREQIEIIKKNVEKINSSKDFTITSQLMKCRKVSGKGKNMYCRICSHTCHEPCYQSPVDGIRGCQAMSNDFCTVCPGHCHYTMHKILDYKMEYYTEPVVYTIIEKKKTFYDATSKKSKAEHILEYKEKEFEIIQLECLEIQEDIKKSIDKLKQIALSKNVFQSSEEYIDLIITSEMQEKKEGWQKRIKSLETLKQQHRELRALYDGKYDDTIKKFDFFQKEYVRQKKERLKNGDENCSIF